jgi:Ni/Co efflux regulator RcnB
MKKQRLTATLFALICSLSAAPAMAGEVGLSVEFSDSEISEIRAYYRNHSSESVEKSNGKNGKSGKGNKSLPPGIAMNLERGKALPPGIAKRSLPMDLIEVLPGPPRGYERIELDGKVLLVEIATQVIHDVLEDLILH